MFCISVLGVLLVCSITLGFPGNREGYYDIQEVNDEVIEETGDCETSESGTKYVE